MALEYKYDMTKDYMELFSTYLSEFAKERMGKEFTKSSSYDRRFSSGFGIGMVWLRGKDENEKEIEIRLACNEEFGLDMKNITIRSHEEEGKKIVDKFYRYIFETKKRVNLPDLKVGASNC